MKHLDDSMMMELLTAEEINQPTKEHFSQCDRCLIKYTSMKADYDEIMNAKAGKVPEEYIESMNKKFNLGGETNKENVDNSIISKINNVFNFQNIFQPRFMVPVISVAAIFLIVFITWPLSQNIIEPSASYYDYRLSNLGIVRGIDIDDDDTGEIIFDYDYQGRTEEAIKLSAQDLHILLSIDEGNKFSQIPKKGELFDYNKDTLKIILPK